MSVAQGPGDTSQGVVENGQASFRGLVLAAPTKLHGCGGNTRALGEGSAFSSAPLFPAVSYTREPKSQGLHRKLVLVGPERHFPCSLPRFSK